MWVKIAITTVTLFRFKFKVSAVIACISVFLLHKTAEQIYDKSYIETINAMASKS